MEIKAFVDNGETMKKLNDEEALIAEFMENVFNKLGFKYHFDTVEYRFVEQAAQNLYQKAYKAGKEDGGAGV